MSRKAKPCRFSGKVKYDTHEKAAVAAGEIVASVRNLLGPYCKNPGELYTYKCKKCEKWHLTSQKPKPISANHYDNNYPRIQQIDAGGLQISI